MNACKLVDITSTYRGSLFMSCDASMRIMIQQCMLKPTQQCNAKQCCLIGRMCVAQYLEEFLCTRSDAKLAGLTHTECNSGPSTKVKNSTA